MLLSICIPTYNRPKHLLNCLNSLTLQSYKNFEVCISDNASASNIKKLIKPFKKKLNIKFNRNKKNLGFALNLLKVSSNNLSKPCIRKVLISVMLDVFVKLF